MQRYNFIFIYKLFTSLFYHNHIISPQKPHFSLSNPLFSNILVFVLSLSYLHLISTLSSFILRSFFVHSSFILRLFLVHSSFILRSFLTDRATCSYPCDSHLPVWLALFRHTPPSVYDLRPSAYSFFFRLETLFLTFLALLYYSINQLLIYPFY
ncbi:hypothetical protein HMPREF9078_02010, partial [Capnocytophaga sp. oral taxon 380 str. F0488]